MFDNTKNYIPDITEMGCCSCFGFIRKTKKRSVKGGCGYGNNRRISQEFLLDDDDNVEEDMDGGFYDSETTNIQHEHDSDGELKCGGVNRSEEILLSRIRNGMICREVRVKETHQLVRSEVSTDGHHIWIRPSESVGLKQGNGIHQVYDVEYGKDENGNKMVNEYVRECKIGCGSYGKVVLYRSKTDGKQYAIKAFHKSHLLKQRVGPSETAMTDVLREVLIMKILAHPNIVNLLEVIDDPNTDNFYMVLEYVEGKGVSEGSGSGVGLGESTARKYLRDVVSGLMYLHAHNIVHGDIKPDNLLVTSSGTVKIGDFSVSQVFEDDDDELRRSPGTPVFTAPECCLGLTYHGKAADTWAVGVTLYHMLFGTYPFLGDTLQDTYDKIVSNTLLIPEGINPVLKNLVEGLLCKDPEQRMTLNDAAGHPWVVEEEGPIPQYICWCRRSSLHREEPDEGVNGA
ncbi:hypothetical protein IFM89_019721 [Coptis chinensis]|uniref:non-specific serine/threonine protein kinase n=1 Tax=Coptis chinensis TaxID=261450 RepID=A0A835H4Y8_9MAGN|nr:hypothetical protein IFM89_019721 [Coptis chinensis]